MCRFDPGKLGVVVDETLVVSNSSKIRNTDLKNSYIAMIRLLCTTYETITQLSFINISGSYLTSSCAGQFDEHNNNNSCRHDDVNVHFIVVIEIKNRTGTGLSLIIS
jgi:hypothetical protein